MHKTRHGRHTPAGHALQRAATTLALLLVIATGADAQDPKAGASSYLEADDGTRYTLSLPGAKAPREPAPLVVSLHYGGPVSPHYGSGLLESVVEPALRPLGAVMLAPDCGERRWLDCSARVLQLIDEVSARFAIDPQRILLTGYSKGGIGTWDLVAQNRGRFSAAVIMAGHADKALAASPWRTPTRVIHARADELFPISSVEATVAALRENGAPVELQVIEGATHYDTQRFAAPLAQLVPWLQAVWSH